MAIRDKYTLLSTVVRIAGSSNLTYNARLKSVAKHINETFHAESTAIYILDEERRHLSQKVADFGAEEILDCSIPLGEGIAGLCAAARTEVSREKQSLHDDEVFKGTEQRILSLPIPAGKKLYGVVSLGLRRDASLSLDETEVLRDICAVLAGLIQSSKITDWSNKRIQRLTTLNELGKVVSQPAPFAHLPTFILKTCHTYTNSCCTILRIFQYDGFTPGVFKRCRQSFRAMLPSLLKIETQCSAKTALSGMPLLTVDVIADEELPPSYICVPLQYESRMLGTLTFFGKQGDDGRFRNFNEEDREFFESMATAIASALEVAANNRQMALLASENDRKLKELSLLYRISNAMHSTIKLNELIHLTLNALISGTEPIFDRAMLFLVNERAGIIQGMQGVTSETSMGIKTMDEAETLIPTRWEIPEEEMTMQRDSSFSRLVKETRLPLDKSLNISSRAVLEKKLIYLSDAGKEKHTDRNFIKRFGLKEFSAAPLMVKGGSVGLVIVDNPLTGRPISRDDLRFLQLLMNQAGTAIENSMLHSRIEDAHRDFREIQQRLIQGEKLAAIGEMAASIAHELKGPLVSIGGFARRLERKFPADSKERKYTETIVREVGRLEKMLTDTLFFSKRTTICHVPCNINTIIEESLAILSSSLEEKRIKVKMRLYPKISSFCGDFQQLKQVFINLFSNAGEAMKKGGTLTVTVAPVRLDGVPAVSVTVSDTGGGIPLEILNDIFNPFFTTKEWGTGLGLPISHRIVTSHGGKILVHNRPGVGAQFKVILPVHP